MYGISILTDPIILKVCQLVQEGNHMRVKTLFLSLNLLALLVLLFVFCKLAPSVRIYAHQTSESIPMYES